MYAVFAGQRDVEHEAEGDDGFVELGIENTGKRIPRRFDPQVGVWRRAVHATVPSTATP